MSLPKQNTMVWDPKTVEIRTRSVEKSLEPLVRQVTTLVNHYNRQHRKGWCSKKAPQLVRDIKIATDRLVEVGEEIAEDFVEIKEPMLEACREARDAGDAMQVQSLQFAKDPCNVTKRNSMVRAARVLLSSVTRLLCVADMADVQRLLAALKQVDDHLKYLVNVGEMDELLAGFKEYGDDLITLAKQSGQRQADLKNQRHKDELAAARSSLKKSSKLLYTASKAYISHPDADSALENRDFVMNELDNALTTVADVAQTFGEGEQHPYEKTGSLACSFDELLAQLDNEPEDFYQKNLQKSLRSLTEEVVDGSTHIGDTIATSDYMKEKIYAACRNVKEALSTLLNTCVDPIEKKIPEIEAARASMERRTLDLSQQVQKCVVDSVADTFLGTNVPLALLMEAAEVGDESEVKARSVTFLEHAEKLAEVANLSCSMCGNPEGIKMVKISAHQLGMLSQQVAKSAETVAKYPKSKAARENMFLFRDTWLQQLAILTEAVDDITTIDDFLIVSESRILEDTNNCVDAMMHYDVAEINKMAVAIRERLIRVDEIVLAEIQNHEAGPYTENIINCLSKMRETVLPHFVDQVDNMVQSPNVTADDESLFTDAARLVYEAMKDIRKSVRRRNGGSFSETESESDDEEEIIKEEIIPELKSQPPVSPPRDYYLTNSKTASALMRAMSSEQKGKINILAEGLSGDKDRLIAEVNRWDEQGNEIIVVAKRMAVIMMQLSDFTRGQGSLKTSMDVFKAAERIAKYGSKMNSLVNIVAEKCPHSHTRSDLLAYMQQITLYSHQLNMTARVKADVQNTSGEESMGVDSAKSLIQSARNLMNSVMLTVRACYIASTKHRSESRRRAAATEQTNSNTIT